MRIHFIGIGGIGVSALAQYYLKKGHKISGSDLVSSEITELLSGMGAKIYIGKHRAKNIPKRADLVIYSPAVQDNNPELKKAKNLHTLCSVPCVISYPQALGELTKEYFTIAVSGTHGKSTTTAMIGLILKKARLDPTVIIGTKLKEFNNSNCRVGKSRYLVIEADEHFASFLNYWPKIIVLTSIDRDHLDYYKNLNNILKTFKEYIAHLPKNGYLIANRDDKNILKILKDKKLLLTKNILFYSLKNRGAKKIKEILKIPGDHNVSNALAALSVAKILKIPYKISLKALSEYKGAWRRFEEKEVKIGNYKIKLISDYGHHPAEIKTTLAAAREKFPDREIWCVYQPHQYQRTFYLFDDFVKVFKKAPVDKVIITDIYDVAGREKRSIKRKISSKILVKKIKKSSVIYLPKKKIKRCLEKNLKKGQILIIMGAGDIYNLEKEFSTN